MVEDIPVLDKERINKVIEKIENKNGNKISDFSVKEIVLLLHKDQKKEISKINQKIDDHLKKADTILAEHDKIMAHIVDVLPEKGFCEKVNNSIFPEDDKSVAYKVELLWNDRRWTKYLVGGVVAAFLVGLGNLAVQVMFYG